jgi:hypothetical protein
MRMHPEPDELIAYAEAPDAAPNRAAVEAHLRRCRECVLHVSSLRNLRDLEEEGRLFDPADFAAAPSAAVARYLRETKPRPGTSLWGGVTAVLGAIATGLTVPSGLRDADPILAADHNPVPEQDEGKTSSETVRSGGSEASIHSDDGNMNPAHEIHQANPIIGTPHDDALLFPGKQGYSDTCAIRCQEYIIRQYTGLNLPEKFYVDEAKARGWYHPGKGTSLQNAGTLLEHHGIPVHRFQDANIFNLTGELAQGHKVIVGVHADDLWRDNWLWRDIRQALGFSQADHAVVVTGIDTHDPRHVEVIVSDPGTGEVAAHYPIEKFIPAWREGHFFMVSTQAPPPAAMHLPEMAHFDYAAGHLHHIGDMPYEDFRHLALEHELHLADPEWMAHHHLNDDLAHQVGHESHDLPDLHHLDDFREVTDQSGHFGHAGDLHGGPGHPEVETEHHHSHDHFDGQHTHDDSAHDDHTHDSHFGHFDDDSDGHHDA